jgi:hypothetical protein
MSEPTVEDAVRLLKDPENRAMGHRFGREWAEMRPPAVVGELQTMGADLETARQLAVEGAERLGGFHRMEEVSRSNALGTGPWRGGHAKDVLVVPVSALRTPE